MIFIITISNGYGKMLHLELSMRDTKSKGNAMDYMRMKQNLSDAGCCDSVIKEIVGLSESGRMTEALRMMKKARCQALDELHESGRKVDLLDFLIRNTEKEMKQANQ